VERGLKGVPGEPKKGRNSGPRGRKKDVNTQQNGDVHKRETAKKLKEKNMTPGVSKTAKSGKAGSGKVKSAGTK